MSGKRAVSPAPGGPRPQVLPGTLDLMVLATLSRGDGHAYALARRIESATGGVLSVEEGSLFPALQRLERAGAVMASAGLTPTGRRARVYRLTRIGRARLNDQAALWSLVSGAVERVLSAPHGPDTHKTENV